MSRRTLLFRCLFGVVALHCFAESYENVALNKSTWIQHPFDNVNYSASRAVDGRKSDLTTFGGECALSLTGHKTTEWRVDLGSVLYIHHIVIQYATQDLDWGKQNTMTQFFLGFSLYISNKTNKDDGVLCFKDTIYTRDTIPNPVNITCPYHGRYVIYYNNRTHSPYPDGYSKYAVLALCEVEVYGCSTKQYYGEDYCLPCPSNCLESRCRRVDGTCLRCIPGYAGPTCNGECPDGSYGLNCDNNCSINCADPRNCDKVTGQCHDECKNGWKQSKCNEKCSPGKFGHECNESCGVCAGGEPCHHTNGTCLNGCEDGYFGPKCIEVMQSKRPEDQRKHRFLFIGVLIAAGLMVITGFVFIITSKKIRKVIFSQS
ncbi:uncharacterized protein LOC144623900 [Crassostrea virginica]